MSHPPPACSGAADLNTIPISIIDRIEVLEDGASSIYGSDAIAGVVNIITRKNFEGVEVNAYRGEYELGGPTTEASLTLGGGGEKFHGLFVASYYDQEEHQLRRLGPIFFPEARRAASRPVARAFRKDVTRSCDPARPAASLRFVQRQPGVFLRRHAERRHDHTGLESGGSFFRLLTTTFPGPTVSTTRPTTCC